MALSQFDWVTLKPELALAIILPFWSVMYFGMVVLAVPFLTSHNFRPNPMRLAGDTMISICLAIIAFQLLFRYWGLNDAGANARDYLYFTAVTFSTLGFGDFAPSPDSRLAAAFLAIFGNLHLGTIVGSAFFAVQTTKETDAAAPVKRRGRARSKSRQRRSQRQRYSRRR